MESLLDAEPYCWMRKDVEIVIENRLHCHPGNVGSADIGRLHPRSDTLIERSAVWICRGQMRGTMPVRVGDGRLDQRWAQDVDPQLRAGHLEVLQEALG